MPDAFISYALDDADFVRRLQKALVERGVDARIDGDATAGSESALAAGPKIEAADCFLLIVSPSSVASPRCRELVDRAEQQGKRLVPVVCRDVDTDDVPEPIQAHNWIFCRARDDFDGAVDAVVTGIRTDFDWVHEHTRLLVRATEWDGRAARPELLAPKRRPRGGGGVAIQGDGTHDTAADPRPAGIPRGEPARGDPGRAVPDRTRERGVGPCPRARDNRAPCPQPGTRSRAARPGARARRELGGPATAGQRAELAARGGVHEARANRGRGAGAAAGSWREPTAAHDSGLGAGARQCVGQSGRSRDCNGRGGRHRAPLRSPDRQADRPVRERAVEEPRHRGVQS